MKARIAEIFESFQGEGLYLGEKQIFVRFFGCNLSCRFCDTKQDRYYEYEPQELFEEIKLYRGRHHSVSFTGGEPLLQKDFLKEILKLTSKAGYCNYLESNGTLYAELGDLIDYIDIVAMDFKFPTSSGMIGLWSSHRRFLEIAAKKEVFLKAVICEDTSEEDLNEALEIIRQIAIGSVLVLQPNSYDDLLKMGTKLTRFKEICASSGVTACVIPQVHKIAGMK